jgi:hypothetical protein
MESLIEHVMLKQLTQLVANHSTVNHTKLQDRKFMETQRELAMESIRANGEGSVLSKHKSFLNRIELELQLLSKYDRLSPFMKTIFTISLAKYFTEIQLYNQIFKEAASAAAKDKDAKEDAALDAPIKLPNESIESFHGWVSKIPDTYLTIVADLMANL